MAGILSDAGAMKEDAWKMPADRSRASVSTPLCRRARVVDQAWAASTRRSQGVISSKKLVSSIDLVAT